LVREAGMLELETFWAYMDDDGKKKKGA